MAVVADAPLAGQAPILELVELHQLDGEDISPLLDEEREVWSQLLDWDFGASADLVCRFVKMGALSGFALVAGRRVAGYSYYVVEDRKGLVGDLYMTAEYRSEANEERLLDAVLSTLMRTPMVRRIESQLMMLTNPTTRRLSYPNYARMHPRQFMRIGAEEIRALAANPSSGRALYENWRESRQEEAAHLIAGSYHGHVDSEINDQYRSVPGARRFLQNIVQYPGCGAFFQPASLLAFHPTTHQICGLSLASLVSESVGHITQVCVSPAVKGTGVGYELLRRSLGIMADHGCRKVSLTVTSANVHAIELYERMGFETHRRFAAFVWDGF